MSDITRTLIVWKSVLYEGVKHRAKAITPPANSLFWKIENDAWGIKQILYHKTAKEVFFYLPVLRSVVKYLLGGS